MRNLLALPFAALLAIAAHRAGDGDPPLRMTLHVDGSKHELTDGKEVTLTIGDQQVKVKAVVDPERRFEKGGLAFDFPRDMAFAHAFEGDFDSWTLDGDNCVIHVHGHATGDAEVLAAASIQGALSALDKEAKAGKVEVTLGGRKYQGHRGRATALEHTFEFTAIGLTIGAKPFVLMLQDTIGDNGKPSAESSRIRDLLARTLTTGKAQ